MRDLEATQTSPVALYWLVTDTSTSPTLSRGWRRAVSAPLPELAERGEGSRGVTAAPGCHQRAGAGARDQRRASVPRASRITFCQAPRNATTCPRTNVARIVQIVGGADEAGGLAATASSPTPGSARNNQSRRAWGAPRSARPLARAPAWPHAGRTRPSPRGQLPASPTAGHPGAQHEDRDRPVRPNRPGNRPRRHPVRPARPGTPSRGRPAAGTARTSAGRPARTTPSPCSPPRTASDPGCRPTARYRQATARRPAQARRAATRTPAERRPGQSGGAPTRSDTSSSATVLSQPVPSRSGSQVRPPPAAAEPGDHERRADSATARVAR